jgi:uncharacterized protein (TIGR03083 family)
METSPGPWIDALRHSHDRLEALVGPLDLGQLRQRSYCSEWSIAQVLSHIGSGAEVWGLWLDAALSGQDPPGGDTFGPIWSIWNAKEPQAQAADGLRADEAALERLETLDAGQRARLRLQLFGMDLDTAGLARLRLSEHAIHTWDVAVALDPSATVQPDAAGLIIDTVGQITAWAGKPDGKQRRLRIRTSHPERHFVLETGTAVTLTAAESDDEPPDLRLPAEAFIRLVYGRLDPAHTPPEETDSTVLEELRPLFPGI